MTKPVDEKTTTPVSPSTGSLLAQDCCCDANFLWLKNIRRKRRQLPIWPRLEGNCGIMKNIEQSKIHYSITSYFAILIIYQSTLIEVNETIPTGD